MGRSSTAPLDTKLQRNGTKNSSRTVANTQEPPAAKSHHPHLKLPHPHIPKFHHSRHDDELTPPPSSRPSHDPPRPGLPQRQNSVQTRYMTMLLNLDDIPRLHNILAAFFTWVLLAGFLILPGTFTTITKKIDEDDGKSQTASEILRSIKHVQLLVVGGVCSGIGALGMAWLWYKWRRNYVWLLVIHPQPTLPTESPLF
ncbi:hypothetical protein PVAG01_03688 [Phlyctema vagabunda]|uniref:Uncharacterized protein n=1 Tax=Phlyctema vagabunda TaxID=108571 RepID=A0ABR4PM52_9HELO